MVEIYTNKPACVRLFQRLVGSLISEEMQASFQFQPQSGGFSGLRASLPGALPGGDLQDPSKCTVGARIKATRLTLSLYQCYPCYNNPMATKAL